VTRRATDIENLIDEYVQRDAAFQEMVKALAANIPPSEAS